MIDSPASVAARGSNASGLFVLVLLVAMVTPAALRGQACGHRTPAVPVPQSLWLDGVFRPGLNGSPGAPLAPERDSTLWDSVVATPGFHSGLEIFEALDIAGDHLIVAYNAGLSVWNIAGAVKAENPRRVAVRDGWDTFACSVDPICGPFLSFPGFGEDDFLIEDVDALAAGQSTYVALTGKYLSVGTTLWEFDTEAETLSPVFQDLTKISYQVRLVQVPDGPGSSGIYAFATNGQGVSVYDVSHALAISPCLKETGSQCPGVYLGNVGTLGGGRYLDVLQRPGGEILLAVTDGGTTNIDLELWRIANPANPASAQRLFSGLADNTFGTALFNYEGNDYLAVTEKIGTSNNVRIFGINACQGSCSLGAPVFSFPVPPFSTPQMLTYSTSNDTPFLYYGVLGGLGGGKVEQLFDLTTLGRPGQNITELTDGGPTYFDTCRNQNLGYWAWYYPANEFGLKNLSPRMGRFHPETNFFYRAARGVLDVHVWEAGIIPPDPAITTSVVNPDPHGLYWMSDDVTFEAEGSNGCDPAGTWVWTPTTPAGVDATIVGEIGNQITYRFECTGPGRCADAVVSVRAANSHPSCTEASSTAAVIGVKDPSIEIASIAPDSGVFTQCVIVTFEAELAGRGPVDFAWDVDGVEALAGDVLEEDLSTSPLTFDWDTSTVMFDLIFADGFESGDISRWSGVTGRGGTVPVVIELDLDSGVVADSIIVGLTPVTGDPQFGVPPIEISTQDNSTFDFHGNTVLGTASEWTWELEDAAGSSLCTFGIDNDVPCIMMTGQGVTHTWLLQMGVRRVKVTAGNCQTTTTAVASTTVSVVATEPLVINRFELDRLASASACDIDFDCINQLVCTCYVDESVVFKVVATGAPAFYDFDWDGDGTFEDAGNPAVGTSFTNVYQVPIGQIVPGVRARRGAATAERDLREILNIQP